MARKVDVKLFGYYPEANCEECANHSVCDGDKHRNDEDGIVNALRSAYGDRVQVELVNVFSDRMKDYPEIAEYIRKNGLRVPVVTVNGEAKLLGSDATPDAIKKEVDEKLKGPLSFLAGRL
jgi:hypothetical protein